MEHRDRIPADLVQTLSNFARGIHAKITLKNGLIAECLFEWMDGVDLDARVSGVSIPSDAPSYARVMIDQLNYWARNEFAQSVADMIYKESIIKTLNKQLSQACLELEEHTSDPDAAIDDIFKSALKMKKKVTLKDIGL